MADEVQRELEQLQQRSLEVGPLWSGGASFASRQCPLGAAGLSWGPQSSVCGGATLSARFYSWGPWFFPPSQYLSPAEWQSRAVINKEQRAAALRRREAEQEERKAARQQRQAAAAKSPGVSCPAGVLQPWQAWTHGESPSTISPCLRRRHMQSTRSGSVDRKRLAAAAEARLGHEPSALFDGLRVRGCRCY